MIYSVNSSRVQRVGQAVKPKTGISAQLAPSSANSKVTQNTKSGASVSAHQKPNNIPNQALAQPAASTGSATGADRLPNPLANGVVGRPALQESLTLPGAPAVGGGRNVDQVMLQFQQTMLQMTNNFLETQQKVMLAYLNVKAGGQAMPSVTPGNGNATGINGINYQTPFSSQISMPLSLPDNLPNGFVQPPMAMVTATAIATAVMER